MPEFTIRFGGAKRPARLILELCFEFRVRFIVSPRQESSCGAIAAA
jgi:hypothetical protein